MAGTCPLMQKACVERTCMLYDKENEKCSIKMIAGNLGECAIELQRIEREINSPYKR